MENQLVQAVNSQHRNKQKIVLVVIIVTILVILIGISFLVKRHADQAQKSPTQTLDELTASSAPVTSSVQQRGAGLNALEKNSKPITTTREQRQTELQSLHSQ